VPLASTDQASLGVFVKKYTVMVVTATVAAAIHSVAVIDADSDSTTAVAQPMAPTRNAPIAFFTLLTELSITHFLSGGVDTGAYN
jgi:hypothetical protein